MRIETVNFDSLRAAMVANQISTRGISSKAVLQAMRKIPRHKFVPTEYESQAYHDNPLPIGKEQTISQPYIVAYMTEELQLEKTDRVLEIGTGSGYQAAVLAEIADSVYTIEINPSLSKHAQKTLDNLNYKNVSFLIGDGYLGWPEKAPFDAIIVTAAPNHIPPALLDQLAITGRMIIPVGASNQSLILIRKTENGIKKETKLPVRFVPMLNDSISN